MTARRELFEKTKARQAMLRAIPLERVLAELGFEQDANERKRWRGGGFNITITGMKFYDWNQAGRIGSAGGGAFDLVMHVMGCGFKEAEAWLAVRYEAAAVEQTYRTPEAAAVAARRPFTPPERCPENEPLVRRWLEEERGFSPGEAEETIRRGFVYADRRGNAVFPCRDPAGRIVGAELKGAGRGSRFTGMTPGSSKQRGGFMVQIGEPKTLYLVESALDALSLFFMRRTHETDFGAASAAGSPNTPPSWLAGIGIGPGGRRICAFDNDAAGNQAAEQLIRDHGFMREAPEPGGDWNDVLKRRRAAADVSFPSSAVSSAGPSI